MPNVQVCGPRVLFLIKLDRDGSASTLLTLPRIRRKKCDEVKPACSPCKSTGRICDFETSASENNQVQVAHRSHISRTSEFCLSSSFQSNAVLPYHESELRHYEFFQHMCTKEFSLYFGTAVWDDIIMRALLTEPCIFHAALAIGATSRLRYFPSDSLNITNFSAEYSMKKYNLAIRELNNHLDGSARAYELAILASIVFIYLEIFLQEKDKVQMHLQGARAIIQTCQNVPITAGHEFTNFRFSPNLEIFISAISFLELQFLSFGNLSGNR
jgi:hypothetical protein